jgi:hypothetical protein
MALLSLGFEEYIPPMTLVGIHLFHKLRLYLLFFKLFYSQLQ